MSTGDSNIDDERFVVCDISIDSIQYTVRMRTQCVLHTRTNVRTYACL